MSMLSCADAAWRWHRPWHRNAISAIAECALIGAPAVPLIGVTSVLGGDGAIDSMFLVFKTGVSSGPAQAGSIPVRLRSDFVRLSFGDRSGALPGLLATVDPASTSASGHPRRGHGHGSCRPSDLPASTTVAAPPVLLCQRLPAPANPARRARSEPRRRCHTYQGGCRPSQSRTTEIHGQQDILHTTQPKAGKKLQRQVDHGEETIWRLHATRQTPAPSRAAR